MKLVYGGILFSFCIVAWGAWPMVRAPGVEELLKLGIVARDTCAAGEGRITGDVAIGVEEAGLCKRICPRTWKWVGKGDGQCHALSEFNFGHYDIAHQKTPGEPATLYSVVTAQYGAFALTMRTETDNHWYCYEMNTELHIISCANDI